MAITEQSQGCYANSKGITKAGTTRSSPKTYIILGKKQVGVKVFRESFSEAMPIFFNRLKSGFFLCPILIKFSPVIAYGLKFVKM